MLISGTGHQDLFRNEDVADQPAGGRQHARTLTASRRPAGSRSERVRHHGADDRTAARQRVVRGLARASKLDWEKVLFVDG
jgi:hypothetical protein